MFGKINISFAEPWYFLTLAIIPLLIIWYVYRHRKLYASYRYSDLSGLEKLPKTFRQKTRHLPFILRLLAIAAVVIALARPQGNIGLTKRKTESIDVILCLDISGSMLAKDLDPNRLAAAKLICKEFIKGRPDDRIGFVVFEGKGFTQCPLTVDHASLNELIDFVQPGMIGGRTAVGMGLAQAVNRLRKSTAKSKVVILLTDGKSLEGKITPNTAADLAKKYGVRVYTIGVGTRGKALSPVAIVGGEVQYEYMMVDIDEGMMKDISKKTGGSYFRAENNIKLRQIFEEIDQMEKTIIENQSFTHKNDLYIWCMIAAGFFFLAELLLRNLVYKQNP